MTAVGILVGGCGDNDSTAAGPSSTSTTRPGETDAIFAVGQEVTIGDDGFRPRQLVAILGLEVTFRNDSNARVTIEFTNIELRSPEVPPGGSWSFRPTGAISMRYRSADRPSFTGKIQVEPEREPGEIDPTP